jgi:hypothetical protein
MSGLETAGANFQSAVQSGQVNVSATGPGSAPMNTGGQGQQQQSSQNQNVDPVSGKSGADMTSQQRAAADQRAVAEMLDLDGVEKFKFQGKEWTPEELKKAQMFEKDYRKKTAEIAKERQYTVNLKADLAKVKRDPSLAADFRSLYPEQYHNYLDLVLEQAAAEEARDNSTSRSGQSNTDQLPPAVAKQISELQRRLDAYENKFRGIDEKDHAAKVQTIQADLDKMFSGFEKKYDFAIEESVLTKAEALIAKGYEMTPAAWERLWKASHEANQAKAQKWHDKRTQEQLKANQEGGDVGRGGGTPSAGRKRMGLSEATDHMIASLNKG